MPLTALAIFLDLKSHVTDYGSMVTEQRISAESFLSLREESLDFITATHDGTLDADRASSGLASLETEYEQTCSDSPRTTAKAVSQAEKALADGDGVAKDETIDLFLPERLRRG